MAKFTLITGKVVEHELPAVAAQVWNAGKWNNLSVFDYSDGYIQASCVLGWVDIDDSCKRIEIFR